jgi:hypothetical protein
MGDTFEERIRAQADCGDVESEEVCDLLDFRDQRIKSLYNLLVTVTEKKNDIFDTYLDVSQTLEREDGIRRRVQIDQYNNFYLSEISGE